MLQLDAIKPSLSAIKSAAQSIGRAIAKALEWLWVKLRGTPSGAPGPGAPPAGVPAVELRAVSNDVGEADRAKWRFDDALAALAVAVERLVPALR